MTPARNRSATKPDSSDLSGIRTLTLSELLSSPPAHYEPTQSVVCKSTKTTTFSGGPEGIRTPDLLNAICRADIHGGPSGSALYSIPCAIVLCHPRQSPSVHRGLLSNALSEPEATGTL